MECLQCRAKGHMPVMSFSAYCTPQGVGAILLVSKFKFREVEKLTHGHTVNKGHPWDLYLVMRLQNSYSSAPPPGASFANPKLMQQ